MVREPPVMYAGRRPYAGKNPYEGRWRHWYASIADWLLRNPSRPLTECAAELGRGNMTIYYIVNSDIFQAYFEQRKLKWQEGHDFAIRNKLTRLTESSLDVLQKKVDKQGDQLPLHKLVELTVSSLDRLGFAPKQGPAVALTLNQNDQRQVIVPNVTAQTIEEARAAIRLVEAKRQLEVAEGDGANDLGSYREATEGRGAGSSGAALSAPAAEPPEVTGAPEVAQDGSEVQP